MVSRRTISRASAPLVANTTGGGRAACQRGGDVFRVRRRPQGAAWLSSHGCRLPKIALFSAARASLSRARAVSAVAKSYRSMAAAISSHCRRWDEALSRGEFLGQIDGSGVPLGQEIGQFSPFGRPRQTAQPAGAASPVSASRASSPARKGSNNPAGAAAGWRKAPSSWLRAAVKGLGGIAQGQGAQGMGDALREWHSRTWASQSPAAAAAANWAWKDRPWLSRNWRRTRRRRSGRPSTLVRAGRGRCRGFPPGRGIRRRSGGSGQGKGGAARAAGAAPAIQRRMAS